MPLRHSLSAISGDNITAEFVRILVPCAAPGRRLSSTSRPAACRDDPAIDVVEISQPAHTAQACRYAFLLVRSALCGRRLRGDGPAIIRGVVGSAALQAEVRHRRVEGIPRIRGLEERQADVHLGVTPDRIARTGAILRAGTAESGDSACRRQSYHASNSRRSAGRRIRSWPRATRRSAGRFRA
jgi:hypothetical protein